MRSIFSGLRGGSHFFSTAASVRGVSAYDEAVSALYQAAFGDFVAVRKRLAAELKEAGDKDGAARLLKLGRPPVSAWAVNQLWWRERAAFEAFVKAAASVRLGDREASQRHREAPATPPTYTATRPQLGAPPRLRFCWMAEMARASKRYGA
jgi:hypothetical protein